MKNINIDLKDINFNEIKNEISDFLEKIQEDSVYKKKMIILILSSIIVLLLTYGINNYQKGTIETLTSRQTEYNEINSFLKTYNNNAINYKEDLSQIKSRILDEKDIDKANILIAKMAENHNLKIENNKKNEKQENIGANIYAQTTDLNVTGSYDDIIKFVNDIENNDFFISVETFSTNKASEMKNINNAIGVKISYKVFFSKNKSGK